MAVFCVMQVHVVNTFTCLSAWGSQAGLRVRVWKYYLSHTCVICFALNKKNYFSSLGVPCSDYAISVGRH